MCMLSSCCGGDEAALPPMYPPGSPWQKLSRTLIIYMAGENSLAQFVNTDSLEIARGLASIGDGARVVVYIDDTKSSRLCVGTRREPLQVVKVYNRNYSSTNEYDMGAILSDIQSQYPADNYGLVLWSHASGWVLDNASPNYKAPRRSFGIDNGNRTYSNQGEVMDVTTLSRVLSRFPRWEYVFFDACFMQCIEVAYELRNQTDYVIGSPAEIPGPGAPYDRILSYLCQVPADVARAVREYSYYYESGMAGSPYWGAELSLIRTDALEELASASVPCYLEIMADQAEIDCSWVQRYCYSPGTRYTEFYDLKNLMYRSLSQNNYNNWVRAYQKAVPVEALSKQWFSAIPTQTQRQVADVAHCGGVSVFVPSKRYDLKGWVGAYRQFGWYKDAGLSLTGW